VAIICWLDIGDVQEPIPPHAEIDKRGLDARLDVDDAALVDVADVTLVASPLDVEFLQHAVFQDGNPAFLGPGDVDKPFLFHAVSCSGDEPEKGVRSDKGVRPSKITESDPFI